MVNFGKEEAGLHPLFVTNIRTLMDFTASLLLHSGYNADALVSFVL